jgi:hypothetical protein
MNALRDHPWQSIAHFVESEIVSHYRSWERLGIMSFGMRRLQCDATNTANQPAAAIGVVACPRPPAIGCI